MQYQIRRLGVGGILDQTINVTKDCFGLLLTLYAVTLMPFQIVQFYLQATDPTQKNTNPFLIIGVALLGGIAGLVFNAASIHGLASKYISRPTSLGECFSMGMRRFLPVLWTGILMGLAIGGCAMITVGVGTVVMGMIGFPLPLVLIGALVLSIPTAILVMWWILAQEIAVLEHISGSDALGRSKKLMQGNIWKAFLVLFVIGAINFGINFGAGMFLIQQPLVMVAVLIVSQAITSILVVAALVVLYFSARCQHENFDLQMLTSAVAEDAESPR